ncbi:MAG: hypothetical protein GAK31_01461 [Stenotrophomonas maltophilia]|uniref:Transglutaminase-like domain-containing protein n=1 Tax=Stenotrophomonas maltophilia TaxID=40324 RepID=A0A7V8FHS5_STEMA|nr:MAG: hypothetical protein GAK31_01461 [Stenotrophomonas maltophilia]
MPTPAEVLALPPPLRALLQQQVIDRGHSREQRLQALVEMIFSRQGLDLQYDADATLTLAEIWQQRRANCLSFTLLFVTLARKAGIDARVQEVGEVVSWYQDADQGVVFNVGHVNAGVEIAGGSATVDLDRNVLYDRHGPHAISDTRALAHFYNNRGAGRLVAGDADGARQLFAAALQQVAGFSQAWNNLGVLAHRQGDDLAARRAFETVLRDEPDNTAALSNASVLYQAAGLQAQAARLQQRLRRAQLQDPFAQYMQGAQAERAGRLDEAIAHYRRAVRLYDTAHQLHFGLARAYFLRGQLRRANAELTRAQQLGGAPLQARYQAKLDSLARWRAQQRTGR